LNKNIGKEKFEIFSVKMTLKFLFVFEILRRRHKDTKWRWGGIKKILQPQLWTLKMPFILQIKCLRRKGRCY